MEIITLILLGLVTACFFVTLLGRGSRDVCLSGAVFGTLALSAYLLEPWDDYTLILLLALVLMTFYLMAGGIIGNKSE